MNTPIESDRSAFLRWTLLTGFALGLAGVVLLRLGNPPNMGICAACSIRDVTGALQLFSKPPALQYLRPEIPAFILGSMLAAFLFGEFRSGGGSSPALRFVLGAFMMIGALVFLGCPIRLMERLAGGDFLTAGVGLAGMLAGIATASFFLKKGFSLGSGRDQVGPAALFMPILALGLAAYLFFVFFMDSDDPRGVLSTKWHAPVLAAFFVALAVGFFAQRSRFCTTGGFRDIILAGEFRLFWGYVALIITLVAGNIAMDQIWPGPVKQFDPGAAPIAHTAHLWNFLGMYLVGFCAVLLGGCPFRQLVAAGQGNTDAGLTVMGLVMGAAFCHNFDLAAKPDSADVLGGPSTAGMVAVVLGITVCFALGAFCRNKQA
ncbi:MAG: YedE family putative selenium transporter [Planctomycetota bacterium]